ncbi:MAG: hypothetical protein A3H96_05250 [Acidobacteria bacterium RIFCSPLOWO2_02_FULL_67_36]|nr:MAG: hypothetical protein A3H96_05250 [Acidobacteria bacterium RIFCSPLOWO2_02_FULL_67_36]OFW21649.1 MAG: hypothetical protein A3G21_14730 [Acidobacteria bacterium RIFCSPLOWO2_12_FULL_66_21]
MSLFVPMVPLVATYGVFTNVLVKPPTRCAPGLACMVALIAGLRRLTRKRVVRRLRTPLI